MHINVSGLLRNFAGVRRAALAGETVVITTRDGNLLLMAERQAHNALYGALKDIVVHSDDDLDKPTLPDGAWRPDL
ncbi:MAG: hypothetical protein OXF27_02405 [Acidobacteria bacterium]|nr:hypothetical protein [Acidobacteriota bacterium]